MSQVVENYKKVLKRIEEAANRSGRNKEEIKLVAVAKTFPPEVVRELSIFEDVIIGENRVQEAISKKEALSDLNFKWHMIGHLQSNKAKKAVETFDMIHSVHSKKLLRKLETQAEKINKKMDVLIEINIGREENKSGLMVEEVDEILNEAINLKFISVKGFMCIPPFAERAEDSRKYFRKMKELLTEKSKKYPQLNLIHLSMGMTMDFEVAIEEGATYVRVGTAIFGFREEVCRVRYNL